MEDERIISRALSRVYAGPNSSKVHWKKWIMVVKAAHPTRLHISTALQAGWSHLHAAGLFKLCSVSTISPPPTPPCPGSVLQTSERL